MHVRIVRSVLRSTALAAAVTSTLAWAPAASALSTEATASTAPAETPAPKTGSVAITKKDPTGDALQGAAFLLLDATGKKADAGKTDAQGKLTFTDLAPGVYRLKETASGSPVHDVVDDQDVIVTPGATARLTIVDPFKPAQVRLEAKDDKTGKLLPGATVNIGSGAKTLLTLTTGPKGTAAGELPLSGRKVEFWVKQIKAPDGYDVYKPSKTFTAGPGDPVTVTVSNSKTATTTEPDPSQTPTDKPTDAPNDGTSAESKPTPTASGNPDAESSPDSPSDATDETSPKATARSLAHTGADATPWVLGGGGLLVAVGVSVVVAARRRAATELEQDGNGDNS